MTGLAHPESNRAIDDMDRVIAIEPQFCGFYVFRGYLDARKLRLIPTCRDIAAFFLTLDRTEWQFVCHLEWHEEDGFRRSEVTIRWSFFERSEQA